MDKIAIIDIDNTLWQFSDAFFEELRKINKETDSLLYSFIVVKKKKLLGKRKVIIIFGQV